MGWTAFILSCLGPPLRLFIDLDLQTIYITTFSIFELNAQLSYVVSPFYGQGRVNGCGVFGFRLVEGLAASPPAQPPLFGQRTSSDAQCHSVYFVKDNMMFCGCYYVALFGYLVAKLKSCNTLRRTLPKVSACRPAES